LSVDECICKGASWRINSLTETCGFPVESNLLLFKSQYESKNVTTPRDLEEDGAQISQENTRIKEELGLLKKREVALSMDNHFLKEVEIKSLKEDIIRLQQRREDDLQNLQKMITSMMEK
jgi:hypothetical protein